MKQTGIQVAATEEPHLAHESDIHWLAPTCQLPRYVRETVFQFCARRRGPIRWSGRVVGWSNLSPAAKSHNGSFTRRVFWLTQDDPYGGGSGRGAPVEAVDPFTVVPGVSGRMTSRAWGAPIEQGDRQ